MILDKIVIISVATFLIICLSIRYVKRYAPENVLIVALSAISLAIYITFVVMDASIHLYVQIGIFIFAFLLPIITTVLQYNNIIITRKILYFKMKRAYKYKEFDKTISLIEKLVSVEGRKSEYLYILGQCYKELEDFINARDCFSLAIELDNQDYKSYYELGLILDETNKKETAMIMFKKSLEIKPDFYEAAEALGICLTSQGRFEEAIASYTEALKIHTNSFELYYNIGMLEMEIGHLDDAIAAFMKAGQINPNLYTAFYNLGELNFLKGNYDEAIEEYKKILKSGLYGPKAYYKLAIVYSVKKEYDIAMSTLEYAIELDPKFLEMAKAEFAFKGMSDRIDEYITNKENLEKQKKEKKNYMKDRLRLFKRNKKSNAETEMDTKENYVNTTQMTEEAEQIAK